MFEDSVFFELIYNNNKIQVKKLEIANQIIYRIQFPDNQPALIISRALKNTLEKFWTSIPEGRQKEAETIGALIEDYYRSKKD